jgi:hypothetical protein
MGLVVSVANFIFCSPLKDNNSKGLNLCGPFSLVKKILRVLSVLRLVVAFVTPSTPEAYLRRSDEVTYILFLSSSFYKPVSERNFQYQTTV